jgi:hypothetical protein
MRSNPRFLTLLENSRLFDVLYTKLIENNTIDEKVFEILTNYFVSYITYFNLSDEQIIYIQMKFLNEYNLHLREFEKTRTYPYQNRINPPKDRLDYDISLLCSTFLSYHRYCIFETLYNKMNVGHNQNILVVGIGPGIELAVLEDISDNIYAYDSDIGSFITNTFTKVHFSEKQFCYEPDKLYDKILLIELLEHLENPLHLLTDAMMSLRPDGCIHFTTAVNVPQFDHLYNFELQDKELEKCILNNDFEIEYKLDIPHNYKVNVDAYNCYYIIKRRKN